MDKRIVMSPLLGDAGPTSHPNLVVPSKKIAANNSSTTGNKFSYTPGRAPVANHENYPHADLLPHFPDITWAPLEEVEYNDRGLHGDADFKNLLADATEVFDYNPKIGTEISGVDLANLTDAQKDDLARLISIRGVVFFRDQKNLSIEKQRELGAYFGKLHKVSSKDLVTNVCHTNTFV